MNYQTFESPIGRLYLVADEKAVCGIVFESTWNTFKKRFLELTESETPVLRQAKQQFVEYFGRKRKAFDFPMQLEGTAFQKRVWLALSEIPFGQTKTYQQQAVAIQSPKAYRAVGRTNGLNPLCIVLPCHRVVGSNGTLTGYAGGLKAKKFLLELEGVLNSR